MIESSSVSAKEEQKRTPPPPHLNRTAVGEKKKILKKQLSMRETERELKWEQKKKHMYLRSLSGKTDGVSGGEEKELSFGFRFSLTDEDLDELRGSMELGFGFTEENGGRELCRTLPALNLYFAVNRKFSEQKSQLTTAATTATTVAAMYGSSRPRSPLGQPKQQQGVDSWRLFNPGDSPQDVKTKLRHWAQVVACSVRQWC